MTTKNVPFATEKGFLLFLFKGIPRMFLGYLYLISFVALTTVTVVLFSIFALVVTRNRKSNCCYKKLKENEIYDRRC